MAHFAKVENGIVTQVIVAEPDFFETFVDNSPGTWLQTSYNTEGGVHYGEDGVPDGGVALRYNYATIGGSYDADRDAFIDPKPAPSFVLNETTMRWEHPIPHPDDGQRYWWDEATVSWILDTGEM
jgi:hypothetical protein